MSFKRHSTSKSKRRNQSSLEKKIYKSICEKIEHAKTNLNQFEEMTHVECTDLIFSDFGAFYNAINTELGDITDELFNIDNTQEKYTHEWDTIDDLKFALDAFYQGKIFEFHEYYYEGIATVKSLENNFRSAQFLQLATFSIVLTILTFILSNAKILAADSIDFRNVLLVNLSNLLAVDFLFGLVYLFIGSWSKKSKAKQKNVNTMKCPQTDGKEVRCQNDKLKWIIFLVVPIFLVIAIVLISLFMK